MRLRRYYLPLILVLLSAVASVAQISGGTVNVSGAVTAGHCTSFLNQNTIQDAGGICGGTGSSPGGAAGTIQFNNTVFGGIAQWTSNGTTTITGSATGVLDMTAGAISNFKLTGTSGGILGFTGATTLASSGVLGAGLPVVGGGAGATPTAGTRTGNTTQYASWTGATTSAKCVDTDASGNLQVTAADCGAGTVTNSGTLTVDVPIFGNGTTVIKVGTKTGNTNQLATWTGATTAARCVDTDASGNLQITAADCGAGGGTVTASGPPTSGQIPLWTSGTNLSGTTLPLGDMVVGTSATPIVQTKQGVDVRDTSVAVAPTSDFCSALNAAMTTAVTNHNYVEAGNPGGFLTNSSVFCNSDPFAGISNPPYIHFGNYTMTISVPWHTTINPFQFFGDVPSISSGTIIRLCNAAGNVGCGPSAYPTFPTGGGATNGILFPLGGPFTPQSYSTGTATATGTAVVGVGTAFTPQMIDGFICDAQPCSKSGTWGIIASVADATHLTLRQATLTLGGAAFTIILPNATAAIMDGYQDSSANDGLQSSCFGHVYQNITIDTNSVGGAVGYWNPSCQERSLLVGMKFIGQGATTLSGVPQNSTPLSLAITSVNSAGVYTGTMTGCATNACQGFLFHISGYTGGNIQNNIDAIATASTGTTLTFNATTVSVSAAATATSGTSYACAAYDHSFLYNPAGGSGSAGATHYGVTGDGQCGPGTMSTTATSYGWIFEGQTQAFTGAGYAGTMAGITNAQNDTNNGEMDLGTIAGKSGNLLKACVWADGTRSLLLAKPHTEWCTTGVEVAQNNPSTVHIFGINGANTNTKLVWLHSNSIGSRVDMASAGGVSSPVLLQDDATGGVTITGGPNCNTAFTTSCIVPIYVQPNSAASVLGSLTATGGTVNFGNSLHTAPMQVGTTAGKPATCTTGDEYFANDATPGQNMFDCTAANTWVQQLNSGASGANQQLSNLSAVAVNSSLTPGSDNTIDLGSLSERWRNAFLGGTLIWTNGSGAADTGISRGAAGQVDIGTGAAGSIAGNLVANGVATGSATVPAFNGLTFPVIVAPATPSAGTDNIYSDSTDLRLHDKNSAGTIGTTVVSSTLAAHNFATNISVAGVIGGAQPAFTDISGSNTCAQLPALTGDTTSSAGTCATTTSKINGTSFAGTNGDVVGFGAANIPADTGFLATNVVRKDTTNAGAAAMTLDMHSTTGSDAFRTEAKAGFTSGASGSFGEDTTANNYHVFANGADAILCAFSAAPTNGDVVSATVSASNVLCSDAGFLAANVITDTTTATSNALMKGGGSKTITAGDIQDVSSVINSTTNTQTVTYSGGQSASAAATQLGGTLVTAASNSASSATGDSGGVELLPGASTGATQGLQGLLVWGDVYVKAATSTLWDLACESAAMTVNNCGGSPSSWLGVIEAVNSNTDVVVSPPSLTPINASAAVTLGHTVCAGGTAGQVTDSAGTASCSNAQGATVGVVMATSGTWTLPDGVTFTASTTLPLVKMNTASLLPSASGSPALSSVTGSVAQATGTEGAAGDNYTFAGVETASLTYPFVVQNTSTSANSSGALIVTTKGAGGTSQVPLLINETVAAGDFVAAYNAGTVTNGAESGGTKEFSVSATGVIDTYNAQTTAGLGVPAVIGTLSDVTAQSTSQTTVNLIASTAQAGSYLIRYYLDQNAVCATPGPGQVLLTFNWTDATHAHSVSTVALPFLSALSTTGGYLQGVVPIFSATASAISYTSTVTACTTGTATYDVHASVEETK